MLTEKTIAFIGTGNMAEAVIRGLVESNVVTPTQIIGSNIDTSRNSYMESTYNIRTTTDSVEAVAEADVIILAIKPQIFSAVAPTLTIPENAVILSIMAGVTNERLTSALNHDAVVRSMPNTPAMIGQGMTVWTKTDSVTEEQKAQAKIIFGLVGEELFVPSEKYVDMSTALNGSGPAYVYLLLESMIDAGVQLGLSRPMSKQLVLQTFAGSVAYAQQSDAHLATLRNQVTSPGGTTAAALYEFEKGGTRATFANAIQACFARSLELGK